MSDPARKHTRWTRSARSFTNPWPFADSIHNPSQALAAPGPGLTTSRFLGSVARSLATSGSSHRGSALAMGSALRSPLSAR